MNPSAVPNSPPTKLKSRFPLAPLALGYDAETGGRDLNAILKREVRARWRRWPAFAVVMIYALLLGAAVLYRYADLSRNAVNVNQTAQLGHDLFAFMTSLQVIGWLLLAPLLTATSFTSERERGTMLSLHLSSLRPTQIARGKFMSALGFIFLLLLAPLPVVAVCFLLGGVGPWEFLASFALQAATASIGAAIGLACSARQQRAGAAIGGAFVLIALWNLLPPFALLSPWLATSLLLNAQNNVVAVIVLLVSCFLGPVFVHLLLVEAAVALYRPLPPLQQQNKVDPFTLPGASVPPGARRAQTLGSEAAPKPNPLGDFKRLPLVGRIAFNNPVLQREIRIKLQVREGSLGSKGHTPTGLVATLVIFFSLFAIFLVFGSADARYVTWNTFSYTWLVGTLGMAALWASTAFTRERESGMLSSLKLSLLSRWDILGGKAFAPLLALAYYSIALLPVLVPCIRGVVNAGGERNPGISLVQFAATSLLVASAAWLGTVLGLFWSWFARTSWVATAGALGSGFFLLAGTLMGGGKSLLEGARWWHPVVAQSFINNAANQNQLLRVVGTQCALWGGLGLLALVPVWFALGRVTSEASQTRGS